jgi:hypothetical protein
MIKLLSCLGGAPIAAGICVLRGAGSGLSTGDGRSGFRWPVSLRTEGHDSVLSFADGSVRIDGVAHLRDADFIFSAASPPTDAAPNVALLGSYMASAFPPNSVGDAASQPGNDTPPFCPSPILAHPG